jgi:hypothetical protein
MRTWRWKPWHQMYKGTKKVIYGHNAIEGLQMHTHTIGLDSGCVYGNYLTAYILESWEIVTQKARRIYSKIPWKWEQGKIINFFTQFLKKIIWK